MEILIVTYTLKISKKYDYFIIFNHKIIADLDLFSYVL